MARRPSAEEPEAPPPEPDRAEPWPHPRHTLRLHGQARAERAFLEARASGRLPHAWLLTGPKGVGKATLAWRIARTMLAEPAEAGGGLLGGGEAAAPDTLEMTPEHPVFRRVASLGEARLRLLRRGWDAKAKRLRTRIVAEDARGLRTLFERSAADGGWRVAVVDSVDEANPQAANALLKLIEEPPPRSLFLLVSHAPSRLLPTIRSRCRRLALDPLGPEALAAAAAEARAAAGAEDAPVGPALAALSEGSVGEALRLSTLGGEALYADLVGMMAGAPGMDRSRWHGWAEAAGGRAGEARLEATLRLTALLAQRLARAGASGRAPAPEAAPGEAALAARLSPSPAAARLWAEAAATLPARAAADRAVNLDPDRIVLDTFAALDAVARRAAAA